MKKAKYILFMAIAGILMLQASCKKDEISSFTASPAVNFTTKALDYSFLGNPSAEYIQEIEVRIIGNTADHDRTFNAIVVNDAATTAKPTQYRIIGGVVKAGEFTGKLSVALINSAELNTSIVNLKLKLADSEDFKAGNIESSEFVVGWTNQIVLPSWTYYRIFFSVASSNKVYQIIVQLSGLKTLTAAQFRAMGQIAVEAEATKFGDYVKQWNLDHPNDHLKHDTGTLIGQDIVPLYYTKSKYD
ncbi:DUF4843 domain-containing protein [Pedobacter hiemivivus]|uniref:DUF4843 domain-containing protein n=1 Tax=Pedobacter hiemivivus TaxID=2530454 RepID=A0A4R0NBX4_9SPHI|nr:DUF4843 domain-containing protein [Pedobacter hiemivivus]TCC97801.1 DUF4843 domain-containing protein [Pedobacter hiemivivus]